MTLPALRIGPSGPIQPPLGILGADYSSVASAVSTLAGSAFIPKDTAVPAGPFVECELRNIRKSNVIEFGFVSTIVASAGSTNTMAVAVSIDDFATSFIIDNAVDQVTGVLLTFLKMSAMGAVRVGGDIPVLKVRIYYTTDGTLALGGEDGTGAPNARTMLWARDVAGSIVIHGDGAVSPGP